jgi:hypothetical protein
MAKLDKRTCRFCLNPDALEESPCPRCGSPEDYHPCKVCGYDHNYEGHLATEEHTKILNGTYSTENPPPFSWKGNV